MSTITSLFRPIQPTPIERKDSGVEVVIDQFNNFKGFGEQEEETKTASLVTAPTTINFTPSNGSTCLSLYPRTKTFSYDSSVSPSSCLATTPDNQLWRITQAVEESGERFTFERLNEVEETVEMFKNCVVKVVSPVVRRGSSADSGRKLSVGHFSSGLTGRLLPLSPVA